LVLFRIMMFKSVYTNYRKATLFEKLLLVVGVFIGIVGFWLINTIFFAEPGLSWQFITSVFLWILLIFIIVLTDSNESIKEELGTIITEHIEETRILKEEVKLLSKILSSKK
jgi:surface polysaccharide O-acyltransferase-like enzyme